MGAITITNLGKAYKQYPTRWSRLAEWMLPSNMPRRHQPRVLKEGAQPLEVFQELRKSFYFVSRQMRISTETKDFYNAL